MESSKINSIDSVTGMIRALGGGVAQIRILRGRVIAEDPIKIEAQNDAQLIIQKSHLIIPQWLTDHRYKAWISVDAFNEANIEKKEATAFTHAICPESGHTCPAHHYKQDWIVIQNHLEVGDTVIMVELPQSEKFFVLDREADAEDRGAK